MKFLKALILITLFAQGHAQTTFIFKPNADCGKDAIMTNSPTWSNGATPISTPYPNTEWLRVEAWTANAHGSREHDWRSVLEFEELKNIQTAEVISATLLLYAYPGFPHSNGGQAERNASQVYRVIEPWEEDQVTWANQPAVDPDGFISIPQNNNYDSIAVDVTEMVQLMIDDPENSFGFLLRQEDESPYGSMDFASSDYPEYDRAPELIVELEEVQFWDAEPTLEIIIDTSLCFNGIVNLEANTGDDRVIAYEWSDGSRESSLTVEEEGIYWVKAVLENCTILVDSITIIGEECANLVACKLQLPNVFSPNEDGLNDLFEPVIEDMTCLESFEMKIYNRWGDLVFSTDTADQFWDGKMKGDPAPTDVYVYFLNYTIQGIPQTLQMQGDITLIR